MKEVKGDLRGDTLVIELSGRIDSGNAAQAEEEIQTIISESGTASLIIDVQELEYISSAGLRILLRLKKSFDDLRVINAGPEVFELLQMTGFTEIMSVERAYRQVSIEGCEVIGEGANGTVYRIDGDSVVKVYNDVEALDDIENEREVARLALILGVPTAIPYDVVRVGDRYGSVFELLDARSFSKILADHPEKMDWCVQEYVNLLHRIHRIVVPAGRLPDMRNTVLSWVQFVRDYLPEEAGKKLRQLITDVPQDNHMIHGDYHTKNIQLTGDEVLLIDMDTLAVGHPIFEFGSIYNAFVGFGDYDNEQTKRFMGIEREDAFAFWRKSLAAYLGTDDEEAISAVEDKARIIGYTRLIRRSIRRGGLEDSFRKAEIDCWMEKLLELLDRVDTLMFLPSEIKLDATVANLDEVITFLDGHLEKSGCPLKTVNEVELAVEEIYANIAKYAYAPATGETVIRVETDSNPKGVTITFTDQGKPYNPLERDEPDVTLPASERQIGGLGIFLVRKIADSMEYEYRNGNNILTLKKNW